MTKPDTLLNLGILAGPLYVVVSLVLGVTRQGYDPVRHPASMLSLGDGGWLQITNFVLTGLFYITAVLGLRKILKGVGSKWVPRLLFIVGLAFIAGGVFTADPALGFPPGAPEGVPPSLSWHGMLHGVAPVVGAIASLAMQVVLAKRFASKGQRVWMIASIVIGLLSTGLSAAPSFTSNWEKGEFNFIPLWLGIALGYGYTSLVMYKVKKEWQSQRLR
jgi:drug/metabolite transporter (DMT)-like permease